MKVFKCDGKRFSDGEKCTKETTDEDEDGHPLNWITIDGRIANNRRDRHTIIANGLHHFCCWECLYLFLIKNVSEL